MEGIREMKPEKLAAVIVAFAAGAFLLVYAFSSVARTNYRSGWEARNGDIQNIHRVEVDLLPDADIAGATNLLVAWRTRITLRTGEVIEYKTPGSEIMDGIPRLKIPPEVIP